jgi:cyclic pyranopterin phosphate synthase
VPKENLVRIDEAGTPERAAANQFASVHHSALARATVLMASTTASRVAANEISKGDVLGCARIAGIQAAKRTADLIPGALPVLVGGAILEFRLSFDRVDVEASVEAFDRGDVSMQAMTACAVAALTIYDMCKAIDRSMIVSDVALVEEGRDGEIVWRRGELQS